MVKTIITRFRLRATYAIVSVDHHTAVSCVKIQCSVFLTIHITLLPLWLYNNVSLFEQESSFLWLLEGFFHLSVNIVVIGHLLKICGWKQIYCFIIFV